jgi:hypothetical protein
MDCRLQSTAKMCSQRNILQLKKLNVRKLNKLYSYPDLVNMLTTYYNIIFKIDNFMV